MFDPNEMTELAHVKRYRYERAGGGGAHKVHATSTAYDNARGIKERSQWDQLMYRTLTLWRQAAKGTQMDYRWDCLSPTLDRDSNGNVPF